MCAVTNVVTCKSTAELPLCNLRGIGLWMQNRPLQQCATWRSSETSAPEYHWHVLRITKSWRFATESRRHQWLAASAVWVCWTTSLACTISFLSSATCCSWLIASSLSLSLSSFLLLFVLSHVRRAFLAVYAIPSCICFIKSERLCLRVHVKQFPWTFSHQIFPWLYYYMDLKWLANLIPNHVYHDAMTKKNFLMISI